MSEFSEARRCSRCRQHLLRESFASDRSVPDGLQACCRACSAAYHRQRQEAEGRSVRIKVPISYFQRTYGLTQVDLDAMIAEQRSVCRICPAAPAEHVDHCHKTGRVRGVLCFSCNTALGQFKDQADAIRRAAAYVEGNAWKPTLVASGVCQLPS